MPYQGKIRLNRSCFGIKIYNIPTFTIGTYLVPINLIYFKLYFILLLVKNNARKSKEVPMVNNRLRMIFTPEEINRLTIKEIGNSQLRIVANVHGMKCSQAKRFINNIINTVRIIFQLIIIHGYNHGTAIKDMLAQNFSNTHVAEKHVDSYNQGVTHLLIAA